MADMHRSPEPAASEHGATTTDQVATERYLAMVLTALADLPSAEVAEIAEDIGPQLDELAGEMGASVSMTALVERLGTPEQYAQELRAAANYPAVEPERRSLMPDLAWLSLASGVVVVVLFGIDSGLNSVWDALYWQDTDHLLVFTPFVLLPLFAIVWEARGRVTPDMIRALPVYQAGTRLIQMTPTAAREYLNTLRPAWRAARIVIPVVATMFALTHGLASGLQVILPVVALAALLFNSRFARKRLWTVTVVCDAFAAGLAAAFVLTFFVNAMS